MVMFKTGDTKNAVIGKVTDKNQLNKIAKKSDEIVKEMLEDLDENLEEESKDGNAKNRKQRNSNT